MSDKKSFVLYCDYRDHIQLLNDVERGQLFTALFDYVSDGKESDLPPMAKMAFSFIKSQLDRDSEKYEQTVNKRKEAGKKGGIAKAQNIAKLANARFATNPLANLADNVTVNDTVTDNVNETTLSRAPRGSECSDSGADEINGDPEPPKETALERRFAEFWAAYPKKVAKAAALKVWKRLKPTQELTDQMIAAIQTQKASDQWTREGGRYIPNPATWLNGGRWEDEVTEVHNEVNSGNTRRELSAEEYAEGFVLAE